MGMKIYDKWGNVKGLADYREPARWKFAQPTLQDVHPVDPVTTRLSIATRNEQFSWDKLAPVAEVDEQSGTIPIYTAGFWFRRQEGAERAPDGAYLRVGYGVTTDTYACHEIGFEKLLGDVIRAGSQLPDDLQDVDTQFLTNLMQLELEKRVAAAGFVTGVWGTSTTPGATAKWDQYDTSDPIANADTAIRTIRRATGVKPNSLFIGALAWENLKEHPLILDKYKHTQVGIMTPELVAPVLGVPEIIVGESVEETTAEGGAGTRADIWTDNALFLVRNEPGLMVQNGMYTLMWNEKGNIPWGIEPYREEQRRGNVTRIFTHQHPKIVSSAHGYIYLDVIT